MNNRPTRFWWILGLGLVVLAGCEASRPAAPLAKSAAGSDKDWSDHTHGLPFVVGFEPGMQAAQESGKPVLLFVTTTWCGWCKKLAADNFEDPQIRPLLDQYQLVLVDGDEEEAAARQLGADGYPHIVLQSPSGETREVISGYREPAEFRTLLEKGLQGTSASAESSGEQPVAASSEGEKDWTDHTHGLPFIVGYEPGMQAAEAAGKPVLLFVTTTWCGWCKKLAADNFEDPQIRPLLDQYQLVLVDGDEESAAAQKLGAEGYPHIVLQSPTGETREVISGYREPAEFRTLLEKGLQDQATPEA